MTDVTATIRPWYALRAVVRAPSSQVLLCTETPPARVLQVFMGAPGPAGVIDTTAPIDGGTFN